jgi:NAD(P)H-quinone oxidoreductase subunit 5
VVGSLQSSRKVILAWSTVAQMGFLFFELGLGFAGAALLHLIAHGVYKAHAFLRSGTASGYKQRSRAGARAALGAVGMSLGLLFLGLVALSSELGPDSWDVLPLAAVWAVASSQYLLGPVNVAPARRFASYLLLGGAVWASAWAAEAYLASWLAAELPGAAAGGPGALVVVWAGVSALSVAVLLSSVRRWEGRILQPLSVHLHSGLYLGEISDALTRVVWPDTPALVTRKS